MIRSARCVARCSRPSCSRAGIYGVLARRNAVLVLMSIELMLNAVNVNLVAFSADAPGRRPDRSSRCS